MENYQRKKERKNNYTYYLLFFFWSCFLFSRLVFIFTRSSTNNELPANESFDFQPIKNQFKVDIAVFVFRFQWYNSEFFVKKMTLNSFSPKSKINTIQYSNSKIALNSGYNGIYTQNCVGDQAVHIAIPCRIDEIVSYFYHQSYTPWLLIGTNELYYSETKILKLIEFLESEFNPMAENVVIGNFFNKSLIFESGIIFSRAFAKFIIDTDFSFYKQILDKNKVFQNSFYEFLHKNKKKVHIYQNPFSFFTFPSNGTWNSKVFTTTKIKELKKLMEICPNSKKLSQKVNQSIKDLKYVKVAAKDTVSLFISQLFKNETAILAKDLPNLPKQIKIIQMMTPKFSSFMCFDDNKEDDFKFTKGNFLEKEVQL